MRLRLTKRTDYAIRACLYLATSDDDGPVPSRRIAEAMEIPDRFLPQVLADLARSGLVASTNGKRGGYRLTRDPARLSILEIVETVEGPSRSERCVLEERPCDGRSTCALHPVWAAAQSAFVDVLTTASLADIAERHVAALPGPAQAPSPERNE